MIALLTRLFSALEQWLILKNLRGKWELQLAIEKHFYETELEIERLRATSLTDNHIRADRLRDSLLRMQSISGRIAADLSAKGVDTPSQVASPDSGGAVRPADG